MSQEDRLALEAQLMKLLVKGGKDTVKAVYVMSELEKTKWDLRCCPPAVFSIIKQAYA